MVFLLLHQGGRPGSLWALRADPRNVRRRPSLLAGEHPLIFVCLQESGEVVLDGARGVVDAMVATAGHEAPGQANSKTSRLYQLRRKQFFIKPEGARPTCACRLPVRSAE